MIRMIERLCNVAVSFSDVFTGQNARHHRTSSILRAHVRSVIRADYATKTWTSAWWRRRAETVPLAGTPTALTIASARKAMRAVIASSIPMTVHHVSTNHRLFFAFFSYLLQMQIFFRFHLRVLMRVHRASSVLSRDGMDYIKSI